MEFLTNSTGLGMFAEQAGARKMLHGQRQQRRRGRSLISGKQVRRCAPQVRGGAKVHGGRVVEYPDEPLHLVEFGRDRSASDSANRKRGRTKKELPPVKRHPHRLERSHEAIEFRPTLDGTRGQLVLSRVHQDEQDAIVPRPVGARLPFVDHTDKMLLPGKRAADGLGLRF